MATNYTSIARCAALGEIVGIDTFWMHSIDYRLANPPTPEQWKRRDENPDARKYVGPDASWDQKSAFEWGMLGARSRLAGDQDGASYCQTRIDEIKTRNS